MQVDLRIVAMLTKVKPPMAAVDDKYFSGIVAMLRIYTAWWLACSAYIIAMRFSDMNMLSGVF